MQIRSLVTFPCRRRFAIMLLLAGFLLPALPQPAVALGSLPAPVIAPSPVTPPQAAFAHTMQSLAFEENRGQSDPSVRFLAHAHGASLFLAPTEIVQTFAAVPDSDAAPTVLRFGFVGANPAPTITSEEPLARTVSYFLGNDPAQWHAGVPMSAKVRYTDLYPGIDLVWYGNASGELEYDVVIAPGAEPSRFAFAISGADAVTLSPEGDLILRTAGGETRQRAPSLYQTINGARRVVDGGFDIRADGTVGFRVGAYDPALPLVIDPLPSWATFLGGNGTDESVAVDQDLLGNVYVVGYTNGSNFPSAGGGYHSPSSGGYDVYVAKYSPLGALLSVTIIGGTADDQALSVHVNVTSGDVVVGGNTRSTTFPTMAGTVKTSCATGGQQDGFILVLNSALTTLKTSTCLGNTSGSTHNTIVNTIAIKSTNNLQIYVGGTSYGGGLPVTGESPAYGGGASDGFIGNISADLTTLNNLDYVGGAGTEHLSALAGDAAGNLYFTGDTTSSGLGTMGAYQATFTGTVAAFVMKFNASFVKQWASYLNGTGTSPTTYGYGIAVGTDNAAVLTGQTFATAYPTVNPLPGQDTTTGFEWGFLAKFSADGTSLVYSTVLNGGSSTTSMSGVAVDGSNNAYGIGTTYNGSNWPLTPATALQTTVSGNDAAVVVVGPTGTLRYGTVYGGTGGEIGKGIAVGMGSNPVISITGVTGSSTTFPLVNAAQATYGGGIEDSFVVAFTTAPNPFSFAKATVSVTAPSRPVVVDVNSDGQPDLLVASAGTGFVPLINANGTLAPGTAVPFAGTLVTMAAMDVNLDGTKDFVAATTTQLVAWLGNNNGTFQAPITTPLGGSLTATAIAPGFFTTGATTPGVAVLGHNGGGANVVAVYTGDSAGHFTPGPVTTLAGTTGTSIIATLLRPGVTLFDLVVTDSGTNSAYIYLNNGAASFTQSAAITGCPNAAAATAADLNGDGKMDVAVACRGDDTNPGSIKMCTGDGLGNFPMCSTQTVGVSPRCVVAADLDGDGNPDIATCDTGSGTVSICQSNGDGTFKPPFFLAVALNPDGLTVMFANEDGKPDLVWTSKGSDTVAVETNTKTPFANPAPDVFEVYPTTGPPGTRITIKGSGFQQGATVQLLTKGVSLNNVTVSPDGTTITGTIPPDPNHQRETGFDFINVTNPDHVRSTAQGNFLSAGFVFQPPPNAQPNTQPPGPPDPNNPPPLPPSEFSGPCSSPPCHPNALPGPQSVRSGGGAPVGTATPNPLPPRR